MPERFRLTRRNAAEPRRAYRASSSTGFLDSRTLRRHAARSVTDPAELIGLYLDLVCLADIAHLLSHKCD